MARILTHCPTGGGVVATGRHMTEPAFAAMGGRFAFRCSACNAVHHWRKEDAWFETAPGRNLEIADG
jgi:hypothetical protein